MSLFGAEMHDLCKQLATGTSQQQQRAWRTLIAEGALWRGCPLAVSDLSQLDALMQDYEYLSHPSALACAKREHLNDEEESARLLAAARRAGAAAVVAALATHRESVEQVESKLLRWAYRAATLNADDPRQIGERSSSDFSRRPRRPRRHPMPTRQIGERLSSDFLRDDAASLVRRCFALLAPHRADGWQLGAARAAVLMLLNAQQPQRRLSNVPVLLVQNGSGRVARLTVELLADGCGDFFPSPPMFRAFGATWRRALDAARQRVTFPDGCDVQWAIEGDVADVDGASAQAALQGALTLLCDGRLYDTGCALSATVDAAGNLGHVDGIVGEHGAAGPKLLAAKQAHLTRVVISPQDFAALLPQARESLQNEPFPLEVVSAETMAQALEFASGLATGLRKYFELVMALSDREETLPAYMGGRTHTALYVEPDVLKWERKAVEEWEKGRRGEGEREQAGIPSRERERAGERERMAAEAQDIGEDALYGERVRETERREKWEKEREQLEKGHMKRVVMLGPPGQGKSLLAQMEARRLAETALNSLTTQKSGVDGVPLPIVVRLDALTQSVSSQPRSEAEWRLNGTPSRLHRDSVPDYELRRALANALREMGCPEVVSDYLTKHAHEERVWLFLDALDEASSEATLTTFWTALKEEKWQCRVVITSRPYGYKGLPFDVTEYRLAPFSPDQARKFVDGRFEDDAPPKARMGDLLTRSPSVQQISQSPFLLTLLCWVVERHDVPDDITRTQLYDRMILDVLGLPPNGAGGVDEERAKRWLPVLPDIAFTWFRDYNAGRRPIPSDQLIDLIAEHQQRPVPLDDETGQPMRVSELKNLTPAQQADYLLDELKRKRLLVPATDQPATYVVPHRSILEYLTARALAHHLTPSQGGHGSTSLTAGSGAAPAGWQRRTAPTMQQGWHGGAAPTHQLWEFVDKKAWLPAWEEVITFLAGMLKDPVPLLELLSDPQNDDAFRSRLCLAARCLPELKSEIRNPKSEIRNSRPRPVYR